MCFISQVFRCELNKLSAPTGEVAHVRMHVLSICSGPPSPSVKQYIYVSCITYNYNVKTIDLYWQNIPGRFHIPTTLWTQEVRLAQHGAPGSNLQTEAQVIEAADEIRVKMWSKDDIKSVNGCFLCTDWSIFLTGTSSLDKVADVVSSSVNFSVCRVRHQLQDVQITPTTSLGIYHSSKTIWKGSYLPSGKEIIRDYR